MIHLTSNWDIQKALQTPSIVSIKSTQWCIDNGLDGECLAILTFDVQGACKLVHVATRVDETEIDDDEEFFTISWLDGKAQVKRTFKHLQKTLQIVLFMLSSICFTCQNVKSNIHSMQTLTKHGKLKKLKQEDLDKQQKSNLQKQFCNA